MREQLRPRYSLSQGLRRGLLLGAALGTCLGLGLLPSSGCKSASGDTCRCADDCRDGLVCAIGGAVVLVSGVVESLSPLVSVAVAVAGSVVPVSVPRSLSEVPGSGSEPRRRVVRSRPPKRRLR